MKAYNFKTWVTSAVGERTMTWSRRQRVGQQGRLFVGKFSCNHKGASMNSHTSSAALGSWTALVFCSLFFCVLSLFAFMPWYCRSCHLLPPRQPARGCSALSELFKICLTQAEKKTGSQADPSRPSYCCLCLGRSVQPLQVCLFFSLSHTQGCDGSATFVQGSAPIWPYSRKLSVMAAMENNVNIFKRHEAEGYRRGCRVWSMSQKTLCRDCLAKWAWC